MVGVREFARLPLVALVLVGALVATCLTALGEASSPMSRACGAVKGEELSASKASPPGFLAVPISYHPLPAQLLPSGCAPLDHTPAFFSVQLWGDLVPRAPPILL
jgi:hypothetical protein